MPPRLPKIAAGRRSIWRSFSAQPSESSCSICCFAALARQAQSRKRAPTTRHGSIRTRRQTSSAVASRIDHEQNAAGSHGDVSDLKGALLDLQKYFRGYVNLSKLQLALRGLEQHPGQETIRIAVLGLAGDGRASSKVRELVRLLLADPLKEEEEWERTLTAAQEAGRPLLMRIGEDNAGPGDAQPTNRLLQEIFISSPTLNAHRMELLVLETDIASATAAVQDELIDRFLVPNVEIPTSMAGRYSPIRTPVHKALLLGDGIMGAASLVSLQLDAELDTIRTAVNMPGYHQNNGKELPFRVVDVSLGGEALATFRESLNNAMTYEHDWFKSGIPDILEWLKDGTLDTPGGPMKTPLRNLIHSILEDTSRRVQYEESRQLSAILSSRVSSSALNSLRDDLKQWAQRAHTELRDELDIAFEGKRWRKLGWWKLFWRVDDVSMLTGDILNQRFLTTAEKEIIFLAGQIEQAGVIKTKAVPSTAQSNSWAYKAIPDQPPVIAIGSPAPPIQFKDILDKPEDEAIVATKPHPWPQAIPITRSHLTMVTVPALQALAQKLVFQTLSTSAFASAFSGLIYISTLSTSLYEAGAVAAFGIVWSLSRMQKKWEAAREFWEKEVREEGRKAVRSVEGVVADILAEPEQGTIEGAEELEAAKKVVERARQALETAAEEVHR
jgi:hypothetical protein